MLFVAPIQHFCQKHLVNVKKYVENGVSIAIDGCQYRWRPLTPQKLICVKNYSFWHFYVKILDLCVSLSLAIFSQCPLSKHTHTHISIGPTPMIAVIVICNVIRSLDGHTIPVLSHCHLDGSFNFSCGISFISDLIQLWWIRGQETW